MATRIEWTKAESVVFRRGEFKAYGIAVRCDDGYIVSLFKEASDPEVWLSVDGGRITQLSVPELPSKGMNGILETAAPLDKNFTTALMKLLNIRWQLSSDESIRLRPDAFRQFLSSFNGQMPFAVQLDPYAFSIANLRVDFLPGSHSYKAACTLIFGDSVALDAAFRVLSENGLLPPKSKTGESRIRIAAAELPQLVITDDSQVKVINLFD